MFGDIDEKKKKAKDEIKSMGPGWQILVHLWEMEKQNQSEVIGFENEDGMGKKDK